MSEVEYEFVDWYKNTFTYHDAENNILEFTPYYRSDIQRVMTLKKVKKEGCENITLNGKEVDES